MDCLICCEALNKSTRKAVECRYCNFVACMTCCKKDALEVENPRCMNCNKIWYGDDIKFPKCFIDTELRAHVTEFIYDYEKSQFADTITYFKIVHALKAFKNNNKYNLIYNFYSPIIERVDATGDFTLVNNKFDTEALMRHLRSYHEQLIARGNHDDVIPIDLCGDEKAGESSTSRAHIACSAADCLGYLDAKYKCGICNIKYCNKCRNRLVDNHVCNDDDIASLKLILSTTKKCPSCATSIHKIEGCDQMFCVLCKTSFSYKTGKIITGRIHNPHYFDWINSKGGAGAQAVAQNCDDIGPIYALAYENIGNQIARSTWRRYSDVIYRICYPVFNMRYRFDDMARITVKLKAIVNLKTRKQYLSRAIDTAEFKRLCYLNVRQNLRNEETVKIVDVIKLMHEDLLINIVELLNKKYKERVLSSMKELTPLTGLIDDLFYLIHTGCILMNTTAENFNKTKTKNINNQVHFYFPKFRGDITKYNVCFGEDTYALAQSLYS